MELISLILIIFFIFLLVRTENLRKEIQHLHQRITGLSIQVKGFTDEKKSPNQEPEQIRGRCPERPPAPPPLHASTAPLAAQKTATGTGAFPGLGMQDGTRERGSAPPSKK